MRSDGKGADKGVLAHHLLHHPHDFICHGHLSVERRKCDRDMAFHRGRPYQPSQCPTTHASLVSQPFAARYVELVLATNFLDLLGEFKSAVSPARRACLSTRYNPLRLEGKSKSTARSRW
eukprot:SAG31_NODE_1679_length_7544_cov_3.239758_10_plen_120_part_00